MASKIGINGFGRTGRMFLRAALQHPDRARLATAKSIIWKGPLDFFEIPAFAAGTLQMGETVATTPGLRELYRRRRQGAVLAGHPWSKRFTHVPTRRGATLEYLEGPELPGVAALEQ